MASLQAPRQLYPCSKEKMDSKKYYQARSYAYKLDPANYVDLTHDAYVVWFNKTGRNLFDEHRGVITKTIKNLHFTNFRKSRWQCRGVTNKRTFEEFKDQSYTTTTPHDELIAAELATSIENALRTFSPANQEIIGLVASGEPVKDVANDAGVSTQLIYYLRSRLRNKASRN